MNIYMEMLVAIHIILLYACVRVLNTLLSECGCNLQWANRKWSRGQT